MITNLVSNLVKPNFLISKLQSCINSGLPRVFIRGDRERVIEEGSEYQFECVAIANPTNGLNWTWMDTRGEVLAVHNDVNMNASIHTTSDTLTISTVTTNLTGNLTCRVSTSFGSSFAIFQLFVYRTILLN